MKDIPMELLYVLMLLAILGFQYLMKRFAPQAPDEPAWDESLSRIPEEAEDAPAASAAFGAVSGAASDAVADLPRRSAAPVIAVAPARRRFSRTWLIGSRHAVQNAVVVATVLGPCRTFEPHEIRQ
ncbi:hypothetical protein [Candidatus Accumulibacter sp. ACC007]|uniref:hypothetical protein n=1 Tax=Candidatus Accumulibacter sp. ACC007 TaxID=2823333 RepID=UPI0025BF7DE2|nr:hypothetical protein [Candidatus Accumulibacter sp. ACC007]